MASDHKPRVFRLRRIPEHIDRLGAVDLLSKALGDVRPEDIRISSLANAANPWEQPPTRTATLTFLTAPALVLSPNHKETWTLPVPGLKASLLLDSHFFGLTPLNDVVESKHEYDCIAISGLASHPFGSWQPHGGDKSFMWIRDAMSQSRQLESTRFLLYGYDTKLVGSRSFQSVPDLAWTLVSELTANGFASPTGRRLVFMVHSLGGVVMKQALVMMAGSGERERFMLELIKGAIFFGVPSKGMVTSHLRAMVKQQPNQVLVNDLSEGSPYLRELENQFGGIGYQRNMKFFWAYETKESPTVVEAPNGSFSRSGPNVVLVKQDSATASAASLASTLQIDENHSDMVKFDEGDSRLCVLASKLTMIENASPQQSSDEPPSAPITAVRRRFSLTENGDNPRGKGIGQIDVSFPDSQASTWLPTMWDEDAVMKHLRAPKRDFRLEHIAVAERHTFEWIFEDERLGFTDWLRHGEGIFWISGKPASGKSTLMKFIYSHHQTWEILHRLGSNTRQITAAFFFHHRGDVVQKSFEGLLRSIVTQILEKQPSLKAILCQALEQHYLGRMAEEKLGDFQADLTFLLGLCGDRPDPDLENAIRSLVNSRQDFRSEIQKIFGDFLRNLDNDATSRRLAGDLLSRRHAFWAGEDYDLVPLLRGVCPSLGLDEDQDFIQLVHRWRERTSLTRQMKRLLRWRGITLTDRIDYEIDLVRRRQERREKIRNAIQTNAWSRRSLEKVLLDVLGQISTELDITFFLDAVDEYDGSPEFISTFLKDLSQRKFAMTRIKICCSSRPWKTFTDHFSGFPGFQMHDHTQGDIRQYCLANINYDLPSARQLYELVPNLVERAKGVFLWVKLVLEDLTKVSADDEAVDEARLRASLSSKVDSLPEELDDYYVTIIRRIPEHLRWDTYVILETLSRESGSMNHRGLLAVLECSTTRTVPESRERLRQLDSLSKREIETRLRVRSGGLVEVVGAYAQMMHQTVKDFVQRARFKYVTLGERAKVMGENGHSLLAWHWIVDPSERPLDHFCHHAAQAEATTGRSQFELLSRAGKTRVDKGLFGDSLSLLQLAVVAGLTLYLKDAALADYQAFRGATSDLYLTLLKAMLNFDRYLRLEFEDVARVITEHGAPVDGSILAEFGLFLKPQSLSGPGRPASLLIQKALDRYEDVDLPITWTTRALSRASATMLHFAGPDLAKYLLARGADANAVTCDGETPLDVLVDYVVIIEERKFTWTVREAYSLTCQLGHSGGKFSKASRPAVSNFLAMFTREDLDTDFDRLFGFPFPAWIVPRSNAS